MKTPSSEFIAKEEGQERFPGELYHIWRTTLVGTEHWRYTSGDVAVVYNGETYEPVELQRGEISYDEKLEANTISITFKYLSQPAAEFVGIGPSELIWISIHKLHRDMVTEETTPIFIGQLKDTSFQGVSAQVTCVGFEHFLKQIVPRLRYGPGCQWNLYDPNTCKIVKASYTTTGVLSGVSANGLTLISTVFSSQTSGYYNQGFIKYGAYYRMISNHTSNSVTLRYPIPGLVTGVSIEVSAGCDKTRATCISKFNNINNHLGFKDIPKDNPAMWT